MLRPRTKAALNDYNLHDTSYLSTREWYEGFKSTSFQCLKDGKKVIILNFHLLWDKTPTKAIGLFVPHYTPCRQEKYTSCD